MPIELAVGDVLQMTVLQDLDLQTVMNTWLWKVSQITPSYGLTLDTVGSDLFTALYSPTVGGNWLHQQLLAQSNYVIHRKWWLQKIYPTRQRRYEAVSGFPGLIQGSPMPPNVAATLTKYTDLAKRSGIGSYHVAGLPKSDEASGVWNSAALIRLQSMATEMNKDQNLGTTPYTLQPGLQNVRLQSSAWKPITAVVPQPTTRVERRRTVGVGI